MRRLLFFIVVFCIMAVTTGSAQKLPFRSYSIEEGLSESVVFDIMQDEGGFLWVGTNYGLNRFDGISFRQYHIEDGLRGNSVTSLYEDSKRRLWVGTDQGVNLMKEDTLVTPSALTVMNGVQINDIFQDREGNLWFATRGKGVFIWSKGGDTLNHIGMEQGLIGNRVRDVEQNSKGSIWLATRDGLSRWKQGMMESFTVEQGLPNNLIRDITINERDHIYIATRGGLSIYREGRFVNYTEADGLINERIRSLTFDSQEGLWLGTEEGLSYFKQGKFQNFGVADGLPNEILYATELDREGNLWLGSFGGGLIRLTGQYFRNFTIDQGLPNEIITDFAEDKQGDVWMASYGGGIIHYDGKKLESLTASDGLVDNKVYTLMKDRQERMWIGTRWGISIYEDGRFTNYGERDMPHRKVRTIHQSLTNNEEYWIGTYGGGLLRFNNGDFKQLTKKDGLAHNIVMDIVETTDGHLWLATYGGVSRFKDGRFTNYSTADGLPANGILDIEKGRKGRIWFATFEGIAYYDGEAFSAITTESVLPASLCYFIKKDRTGIIWIGTNKGVIRFQPNVYENAQTRNERLKAFKLINKSQGLVTDEMNVGAVMESSEGALWFGTVAGASQLLADRVNRNPVPPKIHINDLRVAEEKVALDGPMQFDSDENSFRFDYIGISFQAPELVEYAYRLKGGEEQWFHTSDRRVRYTALAPGSYTFQVKARNAEGLWSKQKTSVSFEIQVPFWWRWWFVSLVVLLMGGIMWFIYRYYRMKKQMEIERMRVRIASDLHDDVGSALTEIALQSDFLQAYNQLDPDELKETLQQIGSQSRRIVSSLDDIVWSIDARNDSVGDLTDRMQDYAYHVFRSSDIDLRFNFEQLDMERKIPVVKRENIYLIFKEAINNISKHSNADQVNISLMHQNDGLHLYVEDNGASKTTTRRTGQGLRNMELRAERVNATLEIDREDGFNVRVRGI